MRVELQTYSEILGLDTATVIWRNGYGDWVRDLDFASEEEARLWLAASGISFEEVRL